MFDLISHLKSGVSADFNRPFLRNVVAALIFGGILAACGGGSGGSITGAGTNNTGGGGTGTDGGGTSTDDGSGTGGTSVTKIGNGTGVAFVEGAAGADTTSLQSGDTVTITVNLVDGDNAPIGEDLIVTFSSNCVGDGRASFSNSSVTTSAGLASAIYTALGCSGDDVITARAIVDSVELVATVTLSIADDQVLAVEYVSSTSTQLSLKGIGGQETAVLTFRLVGASGAPIIGEDVAFALSSSAGGATLAAGRETDETDINGEVTTVLQSGTTAATVSVVATHVVVATGIEISGQSPDIVISTGIPVDDRFSISYGPQNPAGAFDTDGIEVDINIIASDQFGNDALDGTQIRFVSPESGNVDSACTLVDGRCSVKWISAGNRGDLRATVLAFTDGAEAFSDLNGNSVYESSTDTFDLANDDLGEAFADENEDGNYDLGEFFVDVEGHGTAGVRDVGDMEWNGPCLSQTVNSATCSTQDSATIFRSIPIAMSSNSIIITGNPDADGAPIDISGGGESTVIVTLSDAANPANPAPAGTMLAFTGENIQVVAGTSQTVGEGHTSSNGEVYRVTIRTDGTSGTDGLLILTVTAPDGQEFRETWSVTD